MVEITYDLNGSNIKYIFYDNNGKEEYYIDNKLVEVSYLNENIDEYIKEMTEGLEILKLVNDITNIQIKK
ncbi:hypothetical protein [Clostridium perfringens]|uniref:hypothetical protein n=1 Tax=Clostridium perfringens TaxID=1502 RepID=UPI0023420868|nr:hypothetical protein [Clostridium perfringens]MDC4245621.1 hypothetical protein [Clostridium perfringens]